MGEFFESCFFRMADALARAKDGYSCANWEYVLSQFEVVKKVLDAAITQTLMITSAQSSQDPECASCLGYGHLDDLGEPTIDRRCRKCLDCGGTGKR